MSADTLGPWEFGLLHPADSRATLAYWTINIPQHLAAIRVYGADNEPAARLIAAAPEMLEAAEEMRRVADTVNGLLPGSAREKLRKVADKLRRVIARAEGRELVSLQEEIDRS